MYRFFIQPQINRLTGSLVGYELLLKEKTDNGWRPPANFNSVPAEDLADLLLRTTAVLSLKINTVSINLDREQLLNPILLQALIKVQKRVRPTKVLIELTEDEVEESVTDEDIIRQIQLFNQFGIDVILDDVGTGANRFNLIKSIIPYTAGIKVAMQNFRKEHQTEEQIVTELEFFKKKMETIHKSLLVEGMEDERDESLLDELSLNFRQGYYYGRPHLVELI